MLCINVIANVALGNLCQIPLHCDRITIRPQYSRVERQRRQNDLFSQHFPICLHFLWGFSYIKIDWFIFLSAVSKILSMQCNSWQTIYARSWVNSYGRFESAYYISQVCYNNIIDDPLQCTHSHTDTQLSISNWSGVNLSSQFRTFHFTIGQCNLECELQLKCQSIAKRQWEICTIHKCGSNWVESVTERPTLALCLPHSLSLSLSLTDLFTHYAWHATCRQCEDMAS